MSDGARRARLILIEDSDDDAELIERALRAGGVDAEVARVQSLAELEAELARARPDGVISDYRLPGFEAPQALAVVRAFDADLPFLCVSGTIGEEQAVDLLKAGATDYVLKDRSARLVSSLQRALTQARERAERRRTEEALRLSREQFLQAQKMEAVGRLAGGVAHDFNNILTSISGYAELVLQALPKGSPCAEDVREIVLAAERAARLTRQLLAFGRRQVLEVRVQDLNAIVRGVERLLRRVVREDVAISLRLSPEIRRVRVDAGQIEQVLMNLAVNARDAMPRGGTLAIATRPAGERVELVVSDDGEGMTAETAARAFEPFFTTKEKGRGTGLGLATVHGIVLQSGGDIALESAPGRGALFRILLPGTDELPAAERAREPRTAAAPAGARRTILLVEDEPAVRQLLRRVLDAHGYRVLDAADAGGALRFFEDVPDIALAVVDVVMPGGSGPALVERLRAQRPDLRILFISGYADQQPIPGPVGGKPFPFLAKPFSAEVLLAKIRESLAAPL